MLEIGGEPARGLHVALLAVVLDRRERRQQLPVELRGAIGAAARGDVLFPAHAGPAQAKGPESLVAGSASFTQVAGSLAREQLADHPETR